MQVIYAAPFIAPSIDGFFACLTIPARIDPQCSKNFPRICPRSGGIDFFQPCDHSPSARLPPGFSLAGRSTFGPHNCTPVAMNQIA
jgi:hypothetical protein